MIVVHYRPWTSQKKYLQSMVWFQHGHNIDDFKYSLVKRVKIKRLVFHRSVDGKLNVVTEDFMPEN